MKEHPILFKGEMVRAILNGTKTQTRRMVKRLKDPYLGCELAPCEIAGDKSAASLCPHGQVGDRLWVKETTVNVEDHGYVGPVYAESDDGRSIIEYGLSPSPDDMTEVEPEDVRLRPSIFMSRAMSRITLEITGVRVEKLQDISRGDAMAEGCPFPNMQDGEDPRQWYADLWESINGTGSWNANPWVWVIEFQRVGGAA